MHRALTLVARPLARPAVRRLSAQPDYAHPALAELAAKNGGKDALDRAAKRESNGRGYVRKFPAVFAKGQGCKLWDTDGTEYLDCLGVAGTLALGHNHPVTVNAMRKFLDSGAPMQTLDLCTPEKDHFVTELMTVIPKELTRVHFCSPAGTDCLDAAVKMCKIATGRRSVAAFHGGYHGHGQGPLAMMGNLDTKSVVPGLMSDVQFLPFPYQYRNPFGISGEAGDKAVMTYIETMLNDVESGVPKPACVVIEAIQGEGGVQDISDYALRELRRITKEADIPLIVDEVQAGFCRSGNFFAFERSGIVPDVVCLSKALGGTQPMACMVFREELNKWKPASHTGTFRGNQVAFAAGAASLKFMKEERLWEKVAVKGQRLRKHMEDLRDRTNCIGDIRGRGLMQGIEIVDKTTLDHIGMPVPYGALAHEIQTNCFKKRMLLERGGRGGAVMRPLPPLVITEEEIDEFAKRFGEAVEEACVTLKVPKA